MVSVLKQVLKDMKLSLMDCQGHCYDGAANMAGVRAGVATQIASCIYSLLRSCFKLGTGDTM